MASAKRKQAGKASREQTPTPPAPPAEPSEQAFAFPPPAPPSAEQSKRGGIIAGLFIAVLLIGALGFWAWAMVGKWQEVRRYPGAIQAQTALAKNPKDIFAHRTLGYLAQKQGDTQTALREWGEAARLEPQNMHTQWAYANLLWQTGKTSEAESLFKRIAQSTNQVLAPEATKALARIKAGEPFAPASAPPSN